MKWGTRTRVNENEGETYRVRTGSELTRVVSEWVLTGTGNSGSVSRFKETTDPGF